MKKSTPDRYRRSEGKDWIEIRVKSPLQLFNARDPAPFRERDLDDDFIEYVESSAEELGSKARLKLVIYIEESEHAKQLDAGAIKEAIHSYYVYRVEMQQKAFRAFIRRTQLFLIIGIALLVGCLTLSGNLYGPIKEGVVIFGWVSMWKPIEALLYDWYPIYQKLRLLRRLAMSEVQVHFNPKE